MKNFFENFWANSSLIVQRLCSLVWGVAGLGCLFAAYQFWRSLSSLQVYLPLVEGAETLVIVVMAVILLFGILFLLYAVVQFTRKKENGLARFFQKKAPNVILVIVDYAILIFLLCFFTVGEITLRPRYATPLLIVGTILLVLDLCTNLGLFPDQWERSPVIRWIIRHSRKK